MQISDADEVPTTMPATKEFRDGQVTAHVPGADLSLHHLARPERRLNVTQQRGRQAVLAGASLFPGDDSFDHHDLGQASSDQKLLLRKPSRQARLLQAARPDIA
jgi:hypothetical protein